MRKIITICFLIFTGIGSVNANNIDCSNSDSISIAELTREEILNRLNSLNSQTIILTDELTRREQDSTESETTESYYPSVEDSQYPSFTFTEPTTEPSTYYEEATEETPVPTDSVSVTEESWPASEGQV